MAEPITISGQTFIKTDKGWVDKKTKAIAPEGLINLLERMSTGEPTKKLRVKIDRSRGPVTISGQKYVFDSNQNAWITDDAMRWRPPDSMQRVIEEALKQTLGENVDKIVSKMGTIGQAAKSTVKKPDGTKMPVNIKINSPIVSMIEKLATIDGYLKQRLDNQKKIAARNIATTRETAIEAKSVDAEPLQEVKTEDAEKSNAGSIAAALVVGGLIAAQFEPVRDAFKSLVDGVKGVWNFASDVAKTMADGLDFFNGTSSSASSAAGTSSLTSTSALSNSAELAPSEPNIVSASSEGMPSQPNEANASPVTAGEVNEPTPPAATRTSTSGGSTAVGRAVVGAAIGGAVAGPVGAVVGGAIGYLSAPSDSSGDSSSSPSQTPTQATRTDAPAAGGTSNQALSRAVQLAAGQVGIGEAGIGNYLRQGGVGLDPRNEQWCAAFVNSTLAQSGLKGATNVANSFQKWGDNVPVSSVQQGDVVILTRGKGPDVTGGHVGIATGVRQGNKVEIIAGNTSNKVKKYFVENNAENALQVRRYNPEKPYGAGAVGGAPLGSIGETVGAAAGAAWDLGTAAIEAIGGIIKAGVGPQVIRPITDSLVSSAPSIAPEIAAASTMRIGAIAESRSQSQAVTPSLPDPPNLNAGTGSPVVQNLPTASDMAGVDFYLTRMGFPKIEYHNQPSPSRMA